MPYLIDGHNLIPKANLRLDAADDELELIALLQEYCRKSRTTAEVFFDAAPPGYSGSRRFGAITAHFISQRSTADTAIRTRLLQLGRAARNWTVVSSDGEVLAAAAAAHARSEKSELFARRLRGPHPDVTRRGSAQTGNIDRGLSDDEVQRWLDIFKKR